MLFFYNISIRFYSFAALVLSMFSKKAKLWCQGRRGLLNKIENEVNAGESHIWIHCASLGEFEQSRPIIERIKEKYSEKKIVLTFFSPSGYEIRKNYENADYVFYLPVDYKKNAARFVEIINPELAIFVKYDLWYHYLNTLQKKEIPAFVVSANFRPDQVYFKWYGGWFVKLLNKITHFYVQNDGSKNLLDSINIYNVTVAGDVRFDRVYSTAEFSKEHDLLEAFCQKSKAFIAGSTWPPGEELIISYINQQSDQEELKFIIAPHNVNKSNIDRITGQISKKLVKYSEANKENVLNANVLIIDNIGLLASAYKYGHIAYVGGGFGKNLHNVLEATAFGLPVLIGPNHYKFPEVKEMIDLGIVIITDTSESFKQKLDLLISDSEKTSELSVIAKKFIDQKRGATNIIMNCIESG